MEVNRYDIAKIWRLISQWIEETPKPVLATPATLEQNPEETTSTEPHKTPALTRARAKSRTSPSNPFQHLHLHEGHASRQSSPLVTGHVISEADIPDRPAPLSLPPPRLQQDSNNVDLVGSDTSAGSSVPETIGSHKVEERSSSDEIEMPGSGRLTARRFSDDRGAEIQAGLAASLPSHLVMKRRPTLSGLAQQPSAASSRTVTRSSSSANNTITGEAANRHLGKVMPESLASGSSAHARPASNNGAGKSRDVNAVGTQWSNRKEPEESSASELSDPSDVDEEDHEYTAEGLRARGMRQFRVHKNRAKARQSRSKSRRRGAMSADEKPRRTHSGRQSRSVSAARRGQRSMSKVRSEALSVKVGQAQEQAKAMLTHKFGEHLHELLQKLADDVRASIPYLQNYRLMRVQLQGDVQTSATIACALRDEINVDPQFLARITTAYLCGYSRRNPRPSISS